MYYDRLEHHPTTMDEVMRISKIAKTLFPEQRRRIVLCEYIDPCFRTPLLSMNEYDHNPIYTHFILYNKKYLLSL